MSQTAKSVGEELLNERLDVENERRIDCRLHLECSREQRQKREQKVSPGTKGSASSKKKEGGEGSSEVLFPSIRCLDSSIDLSTHNNGQASCWSAREDLPLPCWGIWKEKRGTGGRWEREVNQGKVKASARETEDDTECVSFVRSPSSLLQELFFRIRTLFCCSHLKLSESMEPFSEEHEGGTRQVHRRAPNDHTKTAQNRLGEEGEQRPNETNRVVSKEFSEQEKQSAAVTCGEDQTEEEKMEKQPR